MGTRHLIQLKHAAMSRRRLLSTAAVLPLAGLAACGGQAGPVSFPAVPINITLPPEIKQAVDDVQAIITKVTPIATTVGTAVQQVTAIKDQASGILSKIKSGAGSAVALLKDAATVLGPLVSLLAPQYAGIATAIATLLPSIAGERVAARTGMTPAQARAILYS